MIKIAGMAMAYPRLQEQSQILTNLGEKPILKAIRTKETIPVVAIPISNANAIFRLSSADNLIWGISFPP
jgi:hypothetical protein